MKRYALILAGGKGTRMKSTLPKCIYPFYGKPMLSYIIDACEKVGFDEIALVVGYQREYMKHMIPAHIQTYIQQEQLGTAHAVQCAEDFYRQKEGILVIIPGDMPLVNQETLEQLLTYHLEKHNDLTVVSTKLKQPRGYGRIIKSNHQIIKIVEEKDATTKEKSIQEINTGLYCIDIPILRKNIKYIQNQNASHEYYLTDLVVQLVGKYKVDSYLLANPFFVQGINDLSALSQLEKLYQKKINQQHMKNGVHLILPDTIIIEDTVTIESGATIDAFSILRGKTHISGQTYLPPYSYIVDDEKKKIE